jgi:hypothetical protein
LLLLLALIWIALQPLSAQILSPGVSVLMLLAAFLLMLSLPSVYLKQAEAAGWLGLAGHLLLQAGLMIFVVLATPALTFPGIKVPMSESATVFLLGIALFLGLLGTGIATLLAKVFPRWQAILLLAATAAFFFNFFIAEFLPPIVGQLGSALTGILVAASFVSMGLYIWDPATLTRAYWAQ